VDVLLYAGQFIPVVLQPANLAYCFAGVLIGTLVGVLPGLGPTASIALLLPVTFHLPPEGALIMLAGIYYGSQYGGSTTAILVRIPGEASSVVTCIDGHKMALKGRAGAALGISAFGSFIGGVLALFGLMLLAPPLASFALRFGPPEYFALMILGVLLLAYVGTGSKVRSLLAAALGLFIGTVGQDLITGEYRFTFGSLALADGVGLVPIATGLFGIAEILVNLTAPDGTIRTVIRTRLRSLLPNLEEWRRSIAPIGRGSVLGFALGILPGGGAVISSFVSYAMEKRISRTPERFGEGAIEGVAGPETANNAATSGAFIPLLSLGLPANAVMAMLLAALLIHGIEPGPMLMSRHPDLFWSVVFSMFVGNIILVILNLPLIGIWVQLLKVPYRYLFPVILLLAVVGVYSLSYSTSDLIVLGCAGLLGFALRKLGVDPAPLAFGLVLSPLLETAFRQSMLMSRGSPLIFFERPIALALVAVAVLVVCSPLLVRLMRRGDGPGPRVGP